MAGSPVIQPKVGAVKAPELSLYYSSIYISGSLNACSLGFALSTRSPHYIYVTRWRLSVHLLGFAIFSLSPSSPDLNKTALASVSLSPLTASEGCVRIPSHREGEEVQRSLYRLRRGRHSTVDCTVLFHPAPMREGHRPLLPRCRSVGRSGLPPPT